ncbi:MAG: carboxypeptidase-like regulatory domain-containing protein [Woeseiaceae bacterium]|nr:carboxypeptidase-like regulatory domain-containing protein [Woeseiaceae bacterium]
MENRLHIFSGFSPALIAAIYFLLGAAESVAQEEPTFYLLDFHSDGYLLGESVPAYDVDGNLLVDFGLFLEAVEFQIEQQDELWSGWFRNEDNHFVWRTDLGVVQIASEQGERVPRDEWMQDFEGTYVSVDALERWFDLSLNVDLRQQVLTIHSDEPLPFQLWRERMLARYRYRTGDEREADVIVPDEYHWATMPLADFSTHFLTQRQGGNRSSSGSASLSMGMDLLKHSAVYSGSFAGGSDSSSDTTTRLTISRASAMPDTPLFAGIYSYGLGDIIQSSSNLVAAANTGRGFTIDRYPDNRQGSLGLATITGDAPPGWEVELYRDGSLIEFGTVGTDGRYFFPDQEIPFGENIFIAKLYGPQGQTREDRQTIWGGRNNLAKGDYDFSISHIDFDHHFLDGRPDNVNALPASYATTFSYSQAFTDDLQAGAAYTRAGLGSRARDGTYTDTDYLSFFGSRQVGPGVFVGEAAQQFGAGQAWHLQYLTGFAGQQITVSHSAFNDYLSPATLQQNDLDSENEISVFGSFGLDKEHAYTVSLRHRELADGPSDWRLFNRFSTRIGRVSLTNDLDFRLGDGPDSTIGHLKVASRINGISVRGQLDYQPTDSQPFRQVSASMNWEIGRRLNNNLTITRRLADDHSMFVSNLLSVRVRDYDMTFSVSSDFEGDWSVGAGFSIAFGYDYRSKSMITDIGGLANTGRATMHLFVDEDNDGVRDPHENPVEWASYRDQETLPDVPGVLPLNALPSSRPVQFDMQYLKVDDPFLVPRAQMYELHTHAGSDISIDVALVMTGDIEGTVMTGSAGAGRGARGIIVTLHDKEGREVARTRSEFDGFYSFTSVPSGDYEVRVWADDGRTQLSQDLTLDPKDGYVVLERVYIFE